MELKDSISVLPGVAKQRQLLFSKLNIFAIKDLIEHFPRDYQDRSNIISISDAIDELDDNKEGFVTIKAYLTFELQNTRLKDKVITKGKITDGTETCEVTWFNQPYMKNNMKKNVEYIFSGKITEKYKKYQMDSPDFELFKGDDSLSFGRIIPIYPSTYGLSQKILRNFINIALKEVSGQCLDFIPESIRAKYGLIPREYAIKNIHFPENNESFFIARKTLVFTELFTMQLALMKIKGFVKNKSSHKIPNMDFSNLSNLFPFEMTDAQKKVMTELTDDLKTGYVMNRLIQGDVGSGKTAIAMLIAYLTINSNDVNQVALMAPTEVLASQHYKSFKQYFDILGIETVILSGDLKKKEKEEAYINIQNGKYKLIIGTHAIIQEKVNFHKLAMVITDEQHRFGVRQRAILAEKGENPHILVMTATPIPRTLALILYGDLDISTIDSMPPGRTPIETYAVTTNYRERIYSFLKNQVDNGRQAYVICPTIATNEDSEIVGLQSVLDYTEKLKNVYKDWNVVCLHGKLKQEEKQTIMNSYVNGEIDVLVSTTVIEVGINVPNATAMVIENSERFGLAQLHQLRGRVGRGDLKSYCILISDSKSKLSKERARAMSNTNDGFVISELDLKLRGPGDFFGTMQHGLPEFKIANLFKDMEILKNAQKAAIDIFSEDSNFLKKENTLLGKEIEGFFSFDQNIKINL